MAFVGKYDFLALNYF